MTNRLVERFRRGRLLGREALDILFAHPKLLIFPLLSVAALAGLIAALMSPIVYMPLIKWLTRSYVESLTPALAAGAEPAQVLQQLPWRRFVLFGLLALWLIYAAAAAIMFFFNAALVASVIQYDRTGTVSLSLGLRVAAWRLPQIFAWALFASTIGLLLNLLTRLLDEHLSWFGSLLGFLGEIAFAVATYFVAPILVVDGVGPITAVRRSAGLIKAKWGKVAGAEFMTFWYFWPLHLVSLLAFVGVWMLPSGQHRLWLLAVFVFSSAVTTILSLVTSSVIMSRLYIFASTGRAPSGSNAAIYDDAFARK